MASRYPPMGSRRLRPVGQFINSLSLSAAAELEKIIEDVAMESVISFFSLHRVRHQALNHGLRVSITRISKDAEGRSTGTYQHRIFGSDDQGRSCDRKRRRRSDDDLNATHMK